MEQDGNGGPKLDHETREECLRLAQRLLLAGKEASAEELSSLASNRLGKPVRLSLRTVRTLRDKATERIRRSWPVDAEEEARGQVAILRAIQAEALERGDDRTALQASKQLCRLLALDGVAVKQAPPDLLADFLSSRETPFRPG